MGGARHQGGDMKKARIESRRIMKVVSWICESVEVFKYGRFEIMSEEIRNGIWRWKEEMMSWDKQSW